LLDRNATELLEVVEQPFATVSILACPEVAGRRKRTETESTLRSAHACRARGIKTRITSSMTFRYR
jgi:hypothetical protein